MREIVVLPTGLDCKACGLTLKGYDALHAAGLGGQYAIEERQNALEYYGSEFDPADFYESEYMNE
jgi:hypothetical protein